MQSYNAVKCKYTSVFTGILEYMQLHMNVHKFVKVYKVDIPGYTKSYSGIYVKKRQKCLGKYSSPSLCEEAN